jgi:amino acid transporter
MTTDAGPAGDGTPEHGRGEPNVATAAEGGGISEKGLSAGSVGLIGAVVIGISCIAPAYTLTAALGPTASEVGFQVPAIIIVGFIPMLLVAFGYRELNNRMPDSGTSFTWVTRAFGPWIGWMAGWGLIAATILVLSNLAGIAVDFLFLLIAQVSGNDGIADLATNPVVNVITCLAFMVAATTVSYRDMQTTQKLQYYLVSFQLLVLVGFATVALTKALSGNGFDSSAISFAWFNPLEVDSFSYFAAGLSLSIFIFWGWDVTLTMNEETKDPEKTPGRAATMTVFIIVALYLLLSISLLAYSGVGKGEFGLGNPDIQDNVFFALADPVLGSLAALVSLAVLTSSASSLQSTFVSPARTLLAMGHYGALPPKFSQVSPRFFTPGYATVVASLVASGFYAVMRFASENALWDTITALGMMICFYYGLTAFGCVWYFRKQWFDSARSAFFTLLCPLVGGVILFVLFAKTLVDSMDPEYGSGSSIGGLGLVFVLGMVVIGLGVVIMLWQARVRPAFFRGQTLSKDAPPSARTLRARAQDDTTP